jgi:hypothetical protein
LSRRAFQDDKHRPMECTTKPSSNTRGESMARATSRPKRLAFQRLTLSGSPMRDVNRIVARNGLAVNQENPTLHPTFRPLFTNSVNLSHLAKTPPWTLLIMMTVPT